jgi:hypothetical protein
MKLRGNFAQVTCAVDGEAVQRVFRLLRVSPADEVHKAHVPLQRALFIRLGLDKRGRNIKRDFGQ